MGKIGEMGVKLDMSNAYDRVEWDCFEKLMGKMGFHEKMGQHYDEMYSICILLH